MGNPSHTSAEREGIAGSVRENAARELAIARKTAEEATRDLATANRYLEETGTLAHELAERAAVHAKSNSEFLANMTHEIRTPLNGILGMLDLAMLDPLSPQQREALGFAKQCGDALLNLANDVLDYARYEAGKLTLASVEFSVRGVIASTILPYVKLAEEKNLAIEWKFDDCIPDAVMGDPDRLAQIVRNLLGNAVKFTREGKVSVHVSATALTPSLVELHVSVSDTGIGIPHEKQQRILQPFMQADGSTTRPYGGAGLGLSIASLLAELMGGIISLESVPGRGSNFVCTVTLQQLTSSKPRRTFTNKSKKHILVAEDNVVNQHLATRLLERAGHQVEIAASGKQAIEMLEKGPFDVVLMDIQMPEMDGLQAAEQIRRRERGSGHHIPIVAVTALASESDRQRCFEAGMDAYITKPMRVPELMNMIESVSSEVHL